MMKGKLSGNSQRITLCPQSDTLLQSIKAIGSRKDLWVEDSAAKACFLCQERFSVTRRRHHCRICGQVFCKKCTLGAIELYSSSLRCCNSCIQYLQVTSEADILHLLHSKISEEPKEPVRVTKDSDSEDSDDLIPESPNSIKGFLESEQREAQTDSRRNSGASSPRPEVNSLLHVTVNDGKNLGITRESNGVYCLLSLDRQQVRTAGAKGANGFNRFAKWNESFLFDVTNTNSSLIISVWAEYLGSTEATATFLGEMVLPISSVLNQKPLEKEFKLLSKSKETKLATLSCAILYTPNKNKTTPDDFQYLKVVGRGNFGKVVQVKKKDTGRIYAMKILNKQTVVQNDAVQHTLAERNVLRRVNHPFIVGLRYSFQTDDKLYLVLDYLCGGELFTHLSSVDHFSEHRTKFYAASIVLALGYIHSMEVIYRDLKPENLLLDMDGYVCLTDFGLVKEGVAWDKKTHTYCGSPEYLAPEILLGKAYGKSVDWWALGTFIYEMLSGWPPFFDENQKMMNRRILYEPLTFDPQLFNDDAKSLLRGLLDRNPDKRLGSGISGTEDIMKHPFFSDVDWKKLLNREVDPPFKPHLKHILDTRFFSDEFTNESVKESYVDSHLSKTFQDAFRGFSWAAESEFLDRESPDDRTRRRSRRMPPPTRDSPIAMSDSDSMGSWSPLDTRSSPNMPTRQGQFPTSGYLPMPGKNWL